MIQSLALEESSTTLRLLENLNLAINEARLVRRIMDMRNQAGNIESASGPSIQTQRLRDEVKRLENHLVFIRNRKSEKESQG